MVPPVADREQRRGEERAWATRSAHDVYAGTRSAGKRTLTERLPDHAPRRMPRGTPVIAGEASRTGQIADSALPRLHLLGVPVSGTVPLFRPMGPMGRGPDDGAAHEQGPSDHPGPTGDLPYRAEMERAFGEDFGSVRTELGASLGGIGAVGAARAEVVAFESAQPDRGVVAHELAHVVQHRRAGSAMPSTPVESADSAAEQEAELVAVRVVAGERAPEVRQAPSGQIARMLPSRRPAPAPRVDARTWIDHMLVLSPLRADVSGYLAGARLPPAHPRLTWASRGMLAVKVWGALGNATRIRLALAPLDIFARVDEMRELGDPTPTSGPLKYIPEVAPIIARELEAALVQSVQRLGPRLVAAFDASPALQSSAGDASAISPDALVFSHPLDQVVEEVIREGAIATIRARKAEDDEPAPDRVAPGALRPVRFRWADDPALWNWIRTEPTDATPEEVAKQLLGSTIRAYELRGTAPFYALPPSHAQAIAPERAAHAVRSVAGSTHATGAIDVLQRGAPESALASSRDGEAAGLAQAEHAADGPIAGGDTDATSLAGRCRSQLHLLADSYPELAAARKLAEVSARLADRTRRLQTMQAPEYARLGNLLAQQSAVLYTVAGDLDAIATQIRRLQQATRSQAIDPTLAEIADLVLDAGACSDLPATAHKQLATAHAKHASIPFDAMDAMLDDARAHTLPTHALADQWGPGESGSTRVSPPMTGRQQWEDLRARETQLTGDVLAVRRAHGAGTDQPGATRVLTERARALQIEARLVAAETQCGYMADQLTEQEGVVATIAGQMRDLQSARNALRALSNTMAGIRIRWREKHAQLFALVGSGAQADGEPAAAIRRAIAELEIELAQVGDDKTRAALETAQSELKDMAIARAVVDIAVMIGLTLVTSGLGAAAGGIARGLRMGRVAAQLVNVATQSVAMATLRTVLYHDSFASAFGSELLTNFAGLAALRGVAAGLSKLKLGKSLAVLKEGQGAWKYIAHGTELTIEAVTQAGIQFAAAQADSLVRQGRTLDDDELKMLAIQGIGMFVGNAIAHRLANPALDAISAYAAKVGAPYRRAQVRKLADQVGRTGDIEASQELIREERALVAEELAVLRQIERDPSGRAQIGEQTLATVADQAHHHIDALAQLGVEHALQSGLTEISPGKAWEGSSNQVEPALAEARAAGARVYHEQLGDGSRRHIVTPGANRYTVYERASHPAPDTIREATAQAQSRLAELERRPGSNVKLPANAADAQLLESARAAAGNGAPASRVLDELRRRLPPEQQRGLDAFRKKTNDEQVLEAIEHTFPKRDLAQFLGEHALSKADEKRLKAEILDARAELVRARLVELGVAGDGLVQSRAEELALRIARDLQLRGPVDEARISDAISHADVAELVGDLGEAIARAQLHSDIASMPERSVLANLEVVRQVKDFSTIAAWQAAQRGKGLPSEPNGLYEADGKLWKSITEVDSIVVERSASGSLRPVLFEQVKAGASNTPAEASAQNRKALDALRAVHDGATDVAIYDRIGKNTLGAQRTGELDLSQLDQVQLKSRGLPGKGFDGALDLGGTAMEAKDARRVLEQVARALLGERVARLLGVVPEGRP